MTRTASQRYLKARPTVNTPPLPLSIPMPREESTAQDHPSPHHIHPTYAAIPPPEPESRAGGIPLALSKLKVSCAVADPPQAESPRSMSGEVESSVKATRLTNHHSTLRLSSG